jgi:hypothetical protein
MSTCISPSSHPSDAQLDTATWCGHLLPDGSVYAFLADHRHELFPAELFADLTRQGGGHPSVPCEVIGTVMVLQALEGLSDRETVSALQRPIAWKVACGLRLDDEGFHPTVLVYWRARLRASQRPRRVFAAVGQVVEQTGGLKGRGRRVLDSTIQADAVATQDTVAQLVAVIRRVRRLVPTARGVELSPHDDDRPGKPNCAWNDPQATKALVSGLGDTHHGSGQTRAALTAAGHTQTIMQIPLQSAVPGGLTIHDFGIDTGAGGRWWNGRSPGWSPTAAGGCPTGGSSATSCGGRCGWPRSTCAGCWCSALPATTVPGC